MRKECQQIAMGQRTKREGGSGDDDAQELLFRPPQTVLHNRGHVRQRCECGEDSAKVQYEYSQMRDKYFRLESKYNSLRAREMRMIDRLPKLAQYEVAALPHPWTAHLHPVGRTFYFNHENGVSTWHDPRQVPTPKSEGCQAGSDAFMDSVENDNVAQELWGQKREGVIGLAPADRPSEAKLNGQRTFVGTQTLSESESHLPAHSFSPADETTRTGTRQSGISLDTPRGARMQAKLQVSGPALVAPHDELLTDERAREQAVLDGEARKVLLDGDRLWLVDDDSALAPWDEPARLFSAGAATDFGDLRTTEADAGEAQVANTQSIPLWKASLEILYPAHQDDVSDLLWPQDSNFGSAQNATPGVGGKGFTDDPNRKPDGDGSTSPHIYERPFTRWRILDRLSRYWVFQSRSKLEARDWVSSLSHNILLVDSGRIRPTNFHILAPQPADSGIEKLLSNTTADIRLHQVQSDLQRCTHMLHHSHSMLGHCRKVQKETSSCGFQPGPKAPEAQQRTGGASSQPEGDQDARHHETGTLFGTILENLDAPAQMLVCRHVCVCVCRAGGASVAVDGCLCLS